MRFLSSLCVSLLLLINGKIINGNAPGTFYPFGAGDKVNPRADDGSSSIINFLQRFKFFGRTYNQIYVNNNGHLTFDEPLCTYIPYQFPAHGGKDLIAPFWTDIDNRVNGVISYRQYTSGTVLTRASRDINQYFPGLSFSASWVFVATWDRVAYFSNSGTETSFQVVLISDGHFSFVLMNYGIIAPSQRYVQAGYDTIDSSYHYSILGSCLCNFTSLTYSSNVNVAGRWAFRTDLESQCCFFNGSPVQLGDSFWSDATCQQRCTCTNRGLQCRQEFCSYSKICRPAAFQYSCQNIPRQMCTISGDPHYHTFDNKVFHFQGTCTYVLSEACGNDLPYYRIEGKNEHRGSTRVSWTRMVRVFVYDEEIELVKGHRYDAKVNGTFTLTPITLRSGSIQVYQSGFSVVISTDFGLVVTYDANSYVTISVPYEYQNGTCGLCGDFNLRPEDDFRSPAGVILSSDVDFANSWKAQGDTDPQCHVTCPGVGCLNCTPNEMSVYRDTNHCGILGDVSGPFAACHSVLTPQTYIDDCAYDLCAGGGDQPSLCEALYVYAVQCQQRGVQIGQWRRPGFCEIDCTYLEHSHFETQGTSCSATCSNPSAPVNCPLLSQESCICDAGYILSGGKCVPEANCGCTFEGFYYADGQSVVLDGDCGRQCVCSNRIMTCRPHRCETAEVCGVFDGVRGCRPGCQYLGRYLEVGERLWQGACQYLCVCNGATGNVDCTPSSCGVHETCRMVNDKYGCYPLPYATCSASGDPHYISFDRKMFDFQGTCRYVLATVCNNNRGLPYFRVEARNEAWNGSPVSITAEVFVYVFGHLVHISQNRNRYTTIKVDGETRNLPMRLNSGQLSVYSTGYNTIVSTDFGLSVSYSGSWALNIIVPASYSGVTCGLCGNFNGHSGDDFLTPSGALAPSVDQFGAEWKVEDGVPCNDGCGNNCPPCRDETTARTLCDIIRASQGPFRSCHSYVDPQAYFNDCVFDFCISGHNNDFLCRSIQTYVSACQSANAIIYPWRQNTFCEIICTANNHYELCGTDCAHTCAGSIDASCQHTCSEGCFCDDGFVRSGGLCVPVEQCGCLHEGFYFNIGEQFWNSDCSRHCECFAPNDLRCSVSSCPLNTECSVRNGQRGCYSQMSTCTVWGDPHYISFDGALTHFQGTCSYEIAQTCGNSAGRDLSFRVVATNRHRGSRVVSFVSVVNVWLSLSGEQTHITIEQNRIVKIDGNNVHLPASQISLVNVYEERGFVVVNASNKFMVHFDGHSVLLVRLSRSFYGSVCGMCGNFNGDPADDKAMPSGVLAPNDIAFGNSWKSNISTPNCGHDDGDDPDECPAKQKYSALCSIITNTTGPFQQCHLYVDPAPYYISCVYDLCLLTSANGMLCSAVKAYEAACAILNVQIPEWRPSLKCPVRDPCSELSCTENEWCGEKYGVYGCFCNEDHPSPDSVNFDVSEVCESSSGSISLSRCQLFEAGFSADNLHLNDPSCKGLVRNDRVVFYFDYSVHICGTNLMANGTHLIYENFILGISDSARPPISRRRILRLSFSCIYPQTHSMSIEINPTESIIQGTLPPGIGSYQYRMIAYQDAEFSKPYTGDVTIKLNEQVFVEVRVEGVDSLQFATVIDTCWATPENDPNHSIRWDLIIDECPNPEDGTVEVLQNGVSTSSRFSFRMFFFVTTYPKVYLHCNIHLCLLASNECSTHCYSQQRNRRSVDFQDSAFISLGPLMLSERNTDTLVQDHVKVSKASCLSGTLMILLVSLMSTYTFI